MGPIRIGKASVIEPFIMKCSNESFKSRFGCEKPGYTAPTHSNNKIDNFLGVT